MIGRRTLGLAACALLGAFAVATPLHSAYKGHADERDIQALLAAYPAAKGTAADACATCHRSGAVPAPGGRTHVESHCDFCHTTVVAGRQDIAVTLNAFAKDYLAAGRTAAAVTAIGAKDSDGDGASNDVEILKGTDPGDRASHPGLPEAPARMFTADELRALSPVVRQTVLINTTKNRSGDAYNEYRGNRIDQLLQAMGASPNAESIDVISLDGFERTITVADLRAEWPVGAPVMGFGTKELGGCGWVQYNAPGLTAGVALPPARILLAFEENGAPLEPAAMDPASGRVRGQGPLRVITPQAPPSGPDLGSTADPACAAKVPAERRFHESYDHNGGRSPYAIVAVRVRPLPAGTRDVDVAALRARLSADRQIVFFGALTPAASRR